MSGTIVAKIRSENASYQTHGELPRIGSFAPDVSLVNTKLQDVSLANWTGLRKIMYIGISIDSEVCAKAAIRFDQYATGHDDVALLMVSYDRRLHINDFGRLMTCRRWRASPPSGTQDLVKTTAC